MKSKIIKAIIACLIIGVVATGGYYGYNKFIAAKPSKATTQYMTVTTRKMNMQVTVQGTGSAYASVAKDVSPNNNGVLKNLSLKVGETVKAGDPLFVSDSDDLRQNVSKAQNSLDKQKLSLANAKNDNEIASINLAINDAQLQLNYAYQQLNKMTAQSPIGGIITAVNNGNGDNVQQSKAVISIIDPSSMKIKVSVDELEIGKIKLGQKTEIKFDAIKDKVYEGTVDSIAQVGTSTNNVTSYEVIVGIKEPSNIKVGMNANVNILVDSKENALVIPAEALIEANGKKYVMVPNTNSSTSSSNTSGNSKNASQASQNQTGSSSQGSSWQGGNGQSGNGQSNNKQRNRTAQGGNFAGGNMGAGYSGNEKLVEIKTGLENENYIEVLEGITEGQKLLVTLPQSSSTTNMNNKNSFGSGFGGFSGGMGGRTQGGNNGGKNNK